MGLLASLDWLTAALGDPPIAGEAPPAGPGLLPGARAGGPRFAVDAAAIDPAVFGLTSYAGTVAPAPRVDRRTAISLPAVKRARDLIAGSLGSLPLDLFNPARQAAASPLLTQPEPDRARSVTLTFTIEDLLFEGVAWWQVTQTAFTGYPTQVRRLPAREVTVNDAADAPSCPAGVAGCTGRVWHAGTHLHDPELVRFDSPNDPLLVAGARAIRTALALDTAASRYADEPLPTGWFTPTDDAVGPDEEEVAQLLDAWAEARRRRATAYVPASLAYQTNAFSPADLQLADARQHAVLEVARVAGIDPEELGVSTTSRTYANQFDRRKAFTDFTLGAYMVAVQDRLTMPDVTPRGWYVRFNLDGFLRSDTLTRYQAYALGLQVGAITPEEIRALEDKPALDAAPPDGAATMPTTLPVAATSTTGTVTPLRAGVTFAAGPALEFDAPGARTFEVDPARRTIRGLAVPYGVVATAGGRKYRFNKDSLTFTDPSRVKLWVQHDDHRAVGVMTAATDTDAGKVCTWRIARGPAGDEALSYAEDGVLDGLSVGLGDGATFDRGEDGVLDVVAAPWLETSLTPAPAFDSARVHSVAASATTQEGPTMTVTETAPPPTATPDPPAGVALSAVTDAIRSGFDAMRTQVTPREVVSAGAQLTAQVVREELPYRFNGPRGAHCMTDDLRAHASGDPDARRRLETFMAQVAPTFAVQTGGVVALNPPANHPELYVGNLTYTTPLQDSIATGTITDKTPFTIPKFGSATGLVAPHVEGVEPTPGTFAATSQTVTPTALSGKVQITREVWDQGGSPQADAIIWGEMVNAWNEAREARIATLLNGLSLTETNLAGAVDAALLTAVTNVFVDAQYVRGGNRYTGLVLDGNLFKALVNAQDTGGRKLLPVLAPSNAQGTVTAAFDRVQVGSMTGRAAWALGSLNSSHSYLLVPSSFWQWASGPQRFTFEYQVATIDMAIWGYEASASLRDADAKRIDYTTSDTP
jgi:phage head maturation protease